MFDPNEVHPLHDLENPLKAILERGEIGVGYFLVTGSSILAEVCSTVGLDWLVVDMEAGAFGRAETLQILQTLSGTPVTCIVRVATADRSSIEHALDAGAHGVLVPKIESADQAREVANACRFPPVGDRGVNPIRASGYFGNLAAYGRHANDRTFCIVQIESVKGVECVDEIAAVPGIDSLFIGAGDLAASFGRFGVVIGEEMDRARATVLRACSDHGKWPGIFAYGDDLARQYIGEGFVLIAIGNEVKSLREHLTTQIQYIRDPR